MNQLFDRGNLFDYAGRMKEAYSGSEARDFLAQVTITDTNARPYRQTYTYNVWNNLTNRDAKYWSGTDTFSAAFTNGRRSNWQYDAAGNVTNDTTNNYTFDAAGRMATVQRPAPSTVTESVWLDGDGRTSKRNSQADGNRYYLYSSVLGKVVAELYGDNHVNYYGYSINAGWKSKGFIYAGNSVVEQRAFYYYGNESDGINWRHHDPVTGSDVLLALNGIASVEAQYDPMGIDTGLDDPANAPPSAPYIPDPITPSYVGGGNLGNPACTLDGVEYDCGQLFQLLQHGSASIAPPQTYVPVTANYSDGTSRRIGFAKWNPQNNSYEGTAWWQDQNEQNHYRNISWAFENSSRYVSILTQTDLRNVPVDLPSGGSVNSETNARDQGLNFLKTNPLCREKIDSALALSDPLGLGIKNRVTNTRFIDVNNDKELLNQNFGSKFGEQGVNIQENVGKVLNDIIVENRKLSVTFAVANKSSNVYFGKNYTNIAKILGEQGLIAVHEVLHNSFKTGHLGILKALGLVTQDLDVSDGLASEFLNKWLKNGCR